MSENDVEGKGKNKLEAGARNTLGNCADKWLKSVLYVYEMLDMD